MLARRIFPIVLLGLACLYLSSSAADEPKSRVEIAKRAKAATVLVEAKLEPDETGLLQLMQPDVVVPPLPRPGGRPQPGGLPAIPRGPGTTPPAEPKRQGTGFCIHPSGLFVTNAHVVNALDSEATIVLDSRLKSQKVLKGKVVRRDPRLDLALIRVEGQSKLPVLDLGADVEDELAEVIAFGFPLGTKLVKGGYPEISVNVGSVTSLRRDDKGALNRIQLDNALNPGNSGGPVVDRSGKVVGVVVSGVVGVGVQGLNMAIPVSHVRQFLERPDIQFTPPAIKKADASKPVEFTAKAISLLPDAAPDEMELVLANEPGKERRHPMKLAGGVFRASAVAFLGVEGPKRMRAVIKSADGSVTGTIEDKSFRLGGQTVSLGQIRSLQLGPKAVARLEDGKNVEGELVGLAPLAVTIGKQVLNVDLAGASEITIEARADFAAASCTLVARQKGKELGRLTLPVYLEGTKRDVEALREGKFLRPPRSVVPSSYLKAVSSKGDYIGQGKTYSYSGDQLRIRRVDRGVRIDVENWMIWIGAPRGKFLEVGEYADAKRYAFSDDSPGIDFTGNGRGSNQIVGKFAVWEIELKGNEVVRLAIDFVQHCERTQPPLYGMIRFNSNFE